GVLGAPARGRTRLDAAPLGRGERRSRSARLHDGRRPRADPQARRPVRRRPDDAPADRQGAERPALSTGPRPRPPQTAPFGPEVARVQPFRLLRTPSRCLAPGVSLLAPAGASAVGVEALRMAEHSEL